MSSLLKEEMKRVLFRPEGQKLQEFIEIHEPVPGRHFLCVYVTKTKEVHLCVVRSQKSQKSQYSASRKKLHSQFSQRSGLEDSYLRTEVWLLQDLALLDGRDPDIDDPCFLMHFSTVRSVTAFSCGAKYSLARALVNLSEQHCGRPLTLVNYDMAYIKPSCVYSNRGDCVIVMQICFYAANLVCLSMCPVPLD
ncbi:exocyst complex component 1-like isoform X1 [Esox lucius]|uniref:Exocyst complex component Sec3 PIP2-binding N-terminal domain-containing protein n=1 Tax=Esox lucius TaxID=8010 RepID=A0AAY5KBE5_ESOLU|nr:exocyst complex component 1-like isoform X1 [Esox lucius]